MKQITRAQALREMEVKETPDGKQKTFSIAFHLKDGTYVFFPRAVAAGLRYNMKSNRLRGVVPVDEKLDPIAHVYPVSIDNILSFNQFIVKI